MSKINNEATAIVKKVSAEAEEQVKDFLDDDDLFPVNVILPLLSKTSLYNIITSMLNAVSRCPGSALMHLVTVEALPLYFFYYAYQNLMKNITGGAVLQLHKDKKLNDKIKFEYIIKCEAEFSSEVVMTNKHFDFTTCVGAKAGENSDHPKYGHIWQAEFFYISHIMMLSVCGLFLVFTLLVFIKKGGCKWKMSDARYLAWSYTLWSSRLFRYFGALFVTVFLTSLVLMVASAQSGGILEWLTLTQLPNVAILFVSMRAFLRPARPKFDYTSEDFAKIKFKRTFFDRNAPFSISIASALIQAQRGYPDKLKQMLVKPWEWEHVKNLAASCSTDRGWVDTMLAAVQMLEQGDLAGLADQGIQLALNKMRPRLEPKINKLGLVWSDILPILEAMDTVDELTAAVEDPEGFLAGIAKENKALARKLAMVQLKRLLEPKIIKSGLAWNDVLPIIEAVDTVDELKAAAENPESFLVNIAKENKPLARKIAMVQLKRLLEPKIIKLGLVWSDILPILEAVDNVDKLTAAAEDPDGFLVNIAKENKPLARKLAMVQLRRPLEPKITKLGLVWSDILPILEAVDTVDELTAAAKDPEGFLATIAKENKPLAKKLAGHVVKKAIQEAIKTMRANLEPKINKLGLAWSDILPILEAVDAVDELTAAVEDPEGFLAGIAKENKALARKLAMVQLKRLLEPKIIKSGLAWNDVLPIIEAVDTVDELKAAAENPESFLVNIAKENKPLARKIAMVQLKRLLEPKIIKLGLVWSDILPILEAVDNVDKLTAAAENPEGFLVKIAKENKPLARKIAMAKLKPALEPKIIKLGLVWNDILPILEAVDTIDKLKVAADIPDAFLENIAKENKPFAKKLETAKLKPAKTYQNVESSAPRPINIVPGP